MNVYRVLVLTVYLLLAPALFADGPASAVSAAIKDAVRLPPDVQRNTRYLSMYHMTDAERRLFWAKVAAFHANQLSVEADVVRPRRVGASLVAVDARHYGWDLQKTWELLADADVYFRVEVEKTIEQPYGVKQPDGRWVQTETRKEKVREFVHAPWLPAEQIELLGKLTHSKAPVLRADWWLYQTAVAKDRVAGYYAWIGDPKDRAEFERVIGLDRKLAQRVRREVASIIKDSGVTLQNRQVFRFGTVSGSYWESRDVSKSVAAQNALTQLDGDYGHEAEEIFATLPNGLFAYSLFAADGTRADTAPDNIASDSTSTSNDARVHVGLSCVRCHVEGLRPLNDWSRRVFSRNALVSPDFEKARRLTQLYLSPLETWIERDVAQTAAAVQACNGWTIAENARAFKEAWRQYADEPVTPAAAAAELGVGEVEFVQLVRALPPPVDPILLSLGADPPEPVRREHWEERFSTAMLVVQPLLEQQQ